jgi:hypothetical protein
VSRPNSVGAQRAISRAATHYARAITELNQARHELEQLRSGRPGVVTRTRLADEGLRFLRNELDALNAAIDQPFGHSLKSETPEEGP